VTTVQIAGAGPAGLSAAIALRRRGAHAIIFERRSEIGARFNGDFQGLENWSTRADVRTELSSLGINTEQLPLAPIKRLEVWFGNRGPLVCHTPEPLFYLVRRGSGDGSLDSALLAQAMEAGVEFRFNSPIDMLHHGGLVAAGPHAADFIAEGVTFAHEGTDLAVGVIDDGLAPAGYAYLLRHGGRCTIATVLWRDFKRVHDCLDRTLDWFGDHYDAVPSDAHRFGGYGNFFTHLPLSRGHNILLGEAGGLQDYLFGFGMRYAFRSAGAAVEAVLRGGDTQTSYTQLIDRTLRPQMRASLVNRAIFEALGPASFVLAPLIRADARSLLRVLYNEGIVKRALSPFVSKAYHSRLTDKNCLHQDCECVWCRHGGRTDSEQASL